MSITIVLWWCISTADMQQCTEVQFTQPRVVIRIIALLKICK
jgi:hypothetical protein